MENEINELISSYNEYLSKIFEGCNLIVLKIQQESYQDALRLIVNFGEGCQWLEQANTILKANGVICNLDLNKINEYLLEINNGLEKMDFVLVSDIFEYEIISFFKNHSELIVHNKN